MDSEQGEEMKHKAQINAEFHVISSVEKKAGTPWWSKLSPPAQRKYLKEHPDSELRLSAHPDGLPNGTEPSNYNNPESKEIHKIMISRAAEIFRQKHPELLDKDPSKSKFSQAYAQGGFATGKFEKSLNVVHHDSMGHRTFKYNFENDSISEPGQHDFDPISQSGQRMSYAWGHRDNRDQDAVIDEIKNRATSENWSEKQRMDLLENLATNTHFDGPSSGAEINGNVLELGAIDDPFMNEDIDELEEAAGNFERLIEALGLNVTVEVQEPDEDEDEDDRD